jgi:hypothetical protein
MKPENLEDLLRYRVGQAHETLREAEILLNSASILPRGIDRPFIKEYNKGGVVES